MHYVTVFDAGAAPYRNLFFIVPGLALTFVGSVMVFRPKWVAYVPFFHPSPTKPWFRPFAIIYLLFAVVWTIAAAAAVVGNAASAKSALEHGDCQTIAGRVEHFHPMPASGHDMEQFDVAGVSFSYSDYVITAGFNNSASHGGPIREGLPVRICHRDGEILRLEVMQ